MKTLQCPICRNEINMDDIKHDINSDSDIIKCNRCKYVTVVNIKYIIDKWKSV